MKFYKRDFFDDLIDHSPESEISKGLDTGDQSICVVMASWNEEGKVGKGVRAVPREVVDTILVVNNGSSDNTGPEARKNGAIVIDHPSNLGAGGGYRTGWTYAQRKGFDLIVELAGDNQDLPSEISRAVDKLIDNKLDYVQGSRWLKDGKREKYDHFKNYTNMVVLTLLPNFVQN